MRSIYVLWFYLRFCVLSMLLHFIHVLTLYLCVWFYLCFSGLSNVLFLFSRLSMFLCFINVLSMCLRLIALYLCVRVLSMFLRFIHVSSMFLRSTSVLCVFQLCFCVLLMFLRLIYFLSHITHVHFIATSYFRLEHRRRPTVTYGVHTPSRSSVRRCSMLSIHCPSRSSLAACTLRKARR